MVARSCFSTAKMFVSGTFEKRSMEIGFSYLPLKFDPGAKMMVGWAQGPWVSDSE